MPSSLGSMLIVVVRQTGRQNLAVCKIFKIDSLNSRLFECIYGANNFIPIDTVHGQN